MRRRQNLRHLNSTEFDGHIGVLSLVPFKTKNLTQTGMKIVRRKRSSCHRATLMDNMRNCRKKHFLRTNLEHFLGLLKWSLVVKKRFRHWYDCFDTTVPLDGLRKGLKTNWVKIMKDGVHNAVISLPLVRIFFSRLCGTAKPDCDHCSRKLN